MVSLQQPLRGDGGDGPVAVYVHVPFCPTKCGYCDFNSYAMEGEIVPRTVAAICAEIGRSASVGRPAKTVFFGGGTPTFLSSGQIGQILETVLRAHPPVEGCEVTSEANPGTTDLEKFKDMRSFGFNRLSLGAQSFDTSELIRLGRIHSAGEIGKAIDSARRAGFDNLNIDLMFGLPGQSRHGWARNLGTACEAGTDHLSLYGLTIEPNTRFYRHHQRGTLQLPDDDSKREMYDMAVGACVEAGMGQYEISNFAKSGRECRHNLEYWLGNEYAGYGPGAVQRIGRTRRTNLKHPVGYCAAVEGGADLDCESEHLDDATLNVERIMLGLRLNQGLPLDGAIWDRAGLEQAVDRGWALVEGGRVSLTHEGRHFGTEATVLLMP